MNELIFVKIYWVYLLVGSVLINFLLSFMIYYHKNRSDKYYIKCKKENQVLRKELKLYKKNYDARGKIVDKKV